MKNRKKIAEGLKAIKLETDKMEKLDECAKALSANNEIVMLIALKELEIFIIIRNKRELADRLFKMISELDQSAKQIYAKVYIDGKFYDETT